jgi:hypothetical protein
MWAGHGPLRAATDRRRRRRWRRRLCGVSQPTQVRRSGRLDCRVSLTWKTEDLTARSGREYIGVPPSRLVLEPMQTSALLQVVLRCV